MGKLANNNVMASTRGKVGYVVFKKVNGKMVAANLPDRDPKRVKTTPQELQARRFKRASRYAKAVKDDPALLAMYESVAASKGISSRSIAMGDYFNPPVIHSIDTSNYKGEVGNNIAVDAEDDFLVKRVNVTILLNGVVVESGDAVEDPIKQLWNYAATIAPGAGAILIRATAFDTPGNIVTLEKPL